MSASSSVIASMIKNVNACCSTFVQLFNEKYGRTSLFLMAIWMTSAFVFHGLTIYISEYSKAIEQSYYNQLTVNALLVLFRCNWSTFQFRRWPNLILHIEMLISKLHSTTWSSIGAHFKIAHFDESTRITCCSTIRCWRIPNLPVWKQVAPHSSIPSWTKWSQFDCSAPERQRID